VVVPAALNLGIRAHVIPRCLKGGDRAGRVTWTRFPKGKDVPFRARLSELLLIPVGILGEDLEECRIQRNRSSFARFCLALAHSQVLLGEVQLTPSQSSDL